MNILSVSRRTDIPAFYSDWFISRLKKGYVYVWHPFSKKWLYVSLRPESIGAIVFWSKNFSPLLSRIEVVERLTHNLFFHFTITGNRALEPHTPDWRDSIKDFIYIAERYSPEHIIWRFDPICITDKIGFEMYEEWFTRCAEMLEGYTKRCYISFVNPYKKVLKNFERHSDHTLLEVSETEKRAYALRLAYIGERYGIEIFSCCNNYLLSEKIKKGSCINGTYLSRIFDTPLIDKPSPTRRHCACTYSIDIGAYNTCLHGCVYCYANTNIDRAKEFYRLFDMDSDSLSIRSCFDLSSTVKS